jgi:hypothetical protein
MGVPVVQSESPRPLTLINSGEYRLLQNYHRGFLVYNVAFLGMHGEHEEL